MGRGACDRPARRTALRTVLWADGPVRSSLTLLGDDVSRYYRLRSNKAGGWRGCETPRGWPFVKGTVWADAK